MKPAAGFVALLALCLSVPAHARHVAFVGCPVVRDIAEPDRPCWLAEHGGELYFLGLQSDTIPPITFYPPQLLHKVLVEGELTEDAGLECGGRAFKTVSVSPLPELAPECNTILPQEGIEPPAPVKLSPPFAPGQKLAIPVEGGPDRSYPMRRPAAPEPPFKPRDFRLDFAFGDDFFHLMEGLTISRAVGYFQAIDGSGVQLMVHRDKVLLDDGTVMEEGPEIARRRADRARSVLTEWGIPDGKIAAHFADGPSANGRYLTITVLP